MYNLCCIKVHTLHKQKFLGDKPNHDNEIILRVKHIFPDRICGIKFIEVWYITYEYVK